ncbi:hypothetical protein KQI38_09300 [Tissierella carlieri]|uniref:hypothetical protein n=1 Tax=Tissierella carlieri TaxID=689904 RepID=UPI001C106952|nr:hypothetical protein [Tissierella carlieri]MBU5312222.1 hypothetical protein [Tissierella carlieri]
MSATKATTNTTIELFKIDELKEKNNTPDRIFEGMKAAENWITGKVVTEEVYQRALKEFLESPMGGKKVKKDAKRR